MHVVNVFVALVVAMFLWRLCALVWRWMIREEP